MFVLFYLRLSHFVFATPAPPFMTSSIINIVTCIQLRVYVHRHSLLSPFSIGHLYVCPGLTTYNWMVYLGPHWRKLIPPPLSAIDRLEFVISGQDLWISLPSMLPCQPVLSGGQYWSDKHMAGSS